VTQAIKQALDRVTRISGVRGALVVTGDDGLIVADAVMENIRGDAVAALAASFAGRMSRACYATGVGVPHFVQLQAANGTLLVMPAADVVIVVVADKDVNVGLVRLEMLHAAELVP
jgi:predicted regulator of Ras-like GTPase activity (Roadblock/LC7/MglB family)